MPIPSVQRVYPEVAFGGFTRHDGTLAFYNRVQALAKEPGTQRLLDIGCGRGAHSEDACSYRRAIRDLRAPGRHVLGIDVDPGAERNETLDTFALIEDTAHWPVETESIDMAWADYVLEHVEHPAGFFAELNRVLRPGGVACFRTPNRWGYVALISRLVPNRFHARLATAAQKDREAQDVFPTHYRCNSKRQIRRALTGLPGQPLRSIVYSVEPEPGYLPGPAAVYRLGAAIHRLFPPLLQSTLLVFIRKQTTPG